MRKLNTENLVLLKMERKAANPAETNLVPSFSRIFLQWGQAIAVNVWISHRLYSLQSGTEAPSCMSFSCTFHPLLVLSLSTRLEQLIDFYIWNLYFCLHTMRKDKMSITENYGYKDNEVGSQARLRFIWKLVNCCIEHRFGYYRSTGMTAGLNLLCWQHRVDCHKKQKSQKPLERE